MAGLAWRGTTGLNQPDRCSAVYQCLFSLIRYRNTLYTPTAELSGPANDCRDTHGYIKYNMYRQERVDAKEKTSKWPTVYIV